MNWETASPSYHTTFIGSENPLSEAGRWSNHGLLWTAVRKDGGIAYGTQSGTATGDQRYADSYAAISGFPSDQEAWGEVFIAKFLCKRDLSPIRFQGGSPQCLSHRREISAGSFQGIIRNEPVCVSGNE